jgi:signal transduction histidine kinase
MTSIQTLRASLAWKLSAAFLIVLILLGICYILITATASQQYYRETSQRLNADVAEHLLNEVKPFRNGTVNEEALGQIMHAMMAVNPAVEVYLLDPEGKILSFVVLEKKVRLTNVSLGPVITFLDSKGEEFVLGDDPRHPGEEAIFSAAPVLESGVLLGYVYMVLASEKYETITDALASSYFMRIASNSFLISLIAAFTIGIGLIYLLTRNIRKLSVAVKHFADGNYQARVNVSGRDELATLGHTFNKMADTILVNMEEIKQADNLRKDLVANISHDLRSPMAVIHGYIETLMLKYDQLGAEERVKYMEIILRSSNKLKRLVSDLFELSKLESKNMVLEPEAFSVEGFLRSVSDEYSLMAEAQKVELKLRMDNHLPDISADGHLMHRAMQNLMDNALKFTPENGRIELNARADQERVYMSISNTGPAIPDTQLPHIFDRSYTAGTASHTGSGAGLGLAIVKKIIDMHQALISVKSSDTKGITTFEIIIPLRQHFNLV